MSYAVKVEKVLKKEITLYGRRKVVHIDGWVRVTRKRQRVEVVGGVMNAAIFKTREEAESMAVFVAAMSAEWFGKVKVRECVFQRGRPFTTRAVPL